MKRFRWLAPVLMLSTCATAQFVEHAGDRVAQVASPVLSLLLFGLIVLWVLSFVPRGSWQGMAPPPLERPAPLTGESVPAFKPGGVRKVSRWVFYCSLFGVGVASLSTLGLVLMAWNDPLPAGSQAETVLWLGRVQGIGLGVITGLMALISGIVLLCTRRGPPPPA